MRHVERHIVKENSLLWKQIDNLCFLSKNLYNYANYLIRQSFIFDKIYLGFNQLYHLVKDKPDYQALPRKEKPTSRRIQKLTALRNNQVDTYLHQASRWIINYLDSHGISQLIIGKNPLWKQSVNNGKNNNQAFVSIPHARFVEMLVYKGAMKGIKVVCSEESYTSKASFLSLDYIPTYGDERAKQVKFSGYRETRGMYKVKGKKVRLNADVNASYNIMRKVIPTVFDGGIEGVVVRPIRITPGRAKIGQCYI